MWCIQVGRFLSAVDPDGDLARRWAEFLIESTVSSYPHVFFSDFHLEKRARRER